MNKIKCFLGFHKPNNEWILKWSSKKHYCKCERCDRYIVDGWKRTFDEETFYRMF